MNYQDPDEPETSKVRRAREEKAAKQRAMNERVSGNVLALLGVPPAFDSVHAVPVGQWRYRVNVLVKDLTRMESCEIKSTRIAHSYYVAVNEDGEIVNSCPPIVALRRVG